MRKLPESDMLRSWTIKVHPSLIEGIKRHRDRHAPGRSVSSHVRRILSQAVGVPLRDGVLADAD
jgi:hypothetical protein